MSSYLGLILPLRSAAWSVDEIVSGESRLPRFRENVSDRVCIERLAFLIGPGRNHLPFWCALPTHTCADTHLPPAASFAGVLARVVLTMKGTSVMSDAVCDEACRDVVVRSLRILAEIETLRSDVAGLYDSVVSIAIAHREMAQRALQGPVRADVEERDGVV